MHDWLPDLTARSGRIRDTLANSIEAAVRSGVFRAGETLPTQRLIADLQAIHVDTVNGAVAELARHGLVEGEGFGARPQPASAVTRHSQAPLLGRSDVGSTQQAAIQFARMNDASSAKPTVRTLPTATISQ